MLYARTRGFYYVQVNKENPLNDMCYIKQTVEPISYHGKQNFECINWNHTFRPAVCLSMSCECNSSLKAELILMKLYVVLVHNQRICTKEDNPSSKNVKGDNVREIIICVRSGVSFVILDTV